MRLNVKKNGTTSKPGTSSLSPSSSAAASRPSPARVDNYLYKHPLVWITLPTSPLAKYISLKANGYLCPWIVGKDYLDCSTCLSNRGGGGGVADAIQAVATTATAITTVTTTTTATALTRAGASGASTITIGNCCVVNVLFCNP